MQSAEDVACTAYSPGEPKMRKDELMKPDLLSEVVLTLIGVATIIFLISTLWMAVFGH
jgi:hypothetical protein